MTTFLPIREIRAIRGQASARIPRIKSPFARNSRNSRLAWSRSFRHSSFVIRHCALSALAAVESRPQRAYSGRVLALLDYGSGNLRSVEKALRKVGADVRVITRPDGLKEARGAVLPGVGAFDDCITALQRQELLEAVKSFIASGRPFLGICVGLQALFEESEEFNSCAGGVGVVGGQGGRLPAKTGR